MSFSSQISTSYDAANQATGETTAVTGQPARAISYSYDADGRRISTTYPGGSVVSTGFTDRSQVATIGLDGATVAQYEYNPVGNVTAKTLENGMSALYSYDAAHRLTAIEHRKGADLLASFAYTLDSIGNRKSKAAAGLNPLAENYAYDAVDQVIQAKYGTARTVAYTYDASGNRQLVSDNGTSQTYAANALNQYTSVGGAAHTYDANGNLTGTSSAAYVYDAQNRLVSATVNGTVTTFAYDPRNRVVQRTANGTITNLTYDGWNLIEERDGTGALQQVYVHGAAVDEILTKITTTGAVYYHADGLGSTVALTNETGQLVESTTYDAFGAATIRSASGSVLPASSVANRFLFTGREWVSDTGIYDYRNRVYSPALGRFLQTDPIRFSAGDVNIYRYCGNNPASWMDPMGLCPWNEYPLGDFRRAFADAYVSAEDFYNQLSNDIFGTPGLSGFLVSTGMSFPSMRLPGNPVAKGAPKPSPNFKPPTNPPQMPPENLPPDYKVLRQQPTQQYPNGNWKILKDMGPGSKGQRINPSTMKPGPHPDTHVEFPPGYTGPYDY